jgi:hypothetical protein
MYVVKKGFTLKNGKHYGFGQQVTDEEYEKLNDQQKNNLQPYDEDNPPEEEKDDKDTKSENY